MCCAIIARIDRAAKAFLRPVAARPVFFVLTVLLGTAAPLAGQLIGGQSLKHYTLFTLSVCTVEAWLLCLLLQLLRQRVWRLAVQVLIYAYFGFFALVETGCVCLFNKVLGIDMVGLALETNPAEAGGFFEAYFSTRLLLVWLAAAAMAAATAWIAGRLCRLLRYRTAARCLVAAVLAAVMVYGLMQIVFMARGIAAMNQGQRGPVHGTRTDLTLPIQLNLADPITKTADIICEYRRIYADIDSWAELQTSVPGSPMDCDSTRDFNIALVIGESFIRSHSSLYGYALPTNPLLEKELQAGRLVLFTDMATPANLTTEVMRNVLNLNDVSSGEPWYQSIYFPALIKRAGWNVYHFDNQTVGRGSDSGISRLFYSDFNLQYTLDGVSDTVFAFDAPYARYAADRVANRKPGKSMVIYHLLGQHFPASERYEGEPHFSAADISVAGLDDSKKQLVAHYDNATLYNDAVVAGIIDSWRDSPTLLFYFSDHGEDLPDLGPVGGRVSSNPDDPAWLERQFHIPFMVWISDSFEERYPCLAEKIRRAADRPAMLDKLGYMILGLTGARTPYYKAERDVLDRAWRAEPRMTIGGFSCD